MSSIPKSISTFSPGLNAGRPVSYLSAPLGRKEVVHCDLPMYGQLAHLNASPKKQLPQLLVAFGAALAALDSLSFSDGATSLVAPPSLPSSNTTLTKLLRSSSASSSASPQVQPLHAFLCRPTPPLTGSQAAGRSLSASVSRLSASIVFPRGVMRSQIAFLAAMLRRGRATEVEATDLVFKEKEVPVGRDGFWAITLLSVGVGVRMWKPARVRLDDRSV